MVNKPAEVEKTISQTFKIATEIIVQAFVAGREVTAPVLGNDRPRALPLVEIIPAESQTFYDYQAKYGENGSEHVIPAAISKPLTDKIQQAAIDMLELLGCRGASRSDFILTAEEEVYFLELNTIPGMTSTSLLPQSAQAANINFSRLLDTIITMALK